MNIKILVVDDELVSRNKMLKIVEELGECYSTENGGQTLEFIKENPDIDLILLDILMPDMDGYELYAKLKKRYPLRDFNVIFVTALDKSEYEAKGLDLGGMDYITKPFSPSLVQARVRNRLNMIRAQRRQQASAHDDKMITVGSLAIGMAHEINNPLAGMMQNAQLINNRLTKNIPANEEAAKKAGVTMDGIRKYVQERRIVQQLERINESGIQAAKIVEKILEFSIEEKSAMIKEDLASIIDDALSKTFEDSTIKQIQDLHLIDIQKEYTSKPTQVLSDKRKLTMAFSNIFKNAIQAMQKNSSVYPGAILQINIVNNNKSLVVIIEDNGTGMDEEIKKQVFDPLFSTREVGMGAGLDLAMVFFIITQTHKGLINVSSALGKGSKFIIELPFIF